MNETLDKNSGERNCLDVQIEEQGRKVTALEIENLRLRGELEMIRQSLTWRTVMAFHYYLVEKIAPKGTKLRAWYDSLRSCRQTNQQHETQSGAFSPVIRETERELNAQRSSTFGYSPRISILLPVCETPAHILRNTIESVRTQTYPHWELCVSDDASRSEHVREIVQEVCGQDQRVRVAFNSERKGVSGNSNTALSMASGDYVGFLDHDDMLMPNALYEVVASINKHPRAEFFYTDYAITDPYNRIIDLSLCPDFSRFYYLSHPYIVHFVVMGKALLTKLKGFDEHTFRDGVSHDVDLFLRAFAILDDDTIQHVPGLLYLWRHSEGSSGKNKQDKVHSLTKKAVQRYLDAKEYDHAWVEDGLSFNTFRPRFGIRNEPLVSVIIPTKDHWELLKKCIRSVWRKAGYRKTEIIVVVNNTMSRKALEYHQSLADQCTVVRCDGDFNFSAVCNYGAGFAKGSVLLFLNDDIELIRSDTIQAALELAQLPEIGVTGGKLIYPNRRIQHSGVILGLRGTAGHWHKNMAAYLFGAVENPGYLSSLNAIREYSAVTGAFLMTRKDVFEEACGFNEKLRIDYGDVDYCLKVQSRGYRVLCTPYALAIHHESASRTANSGDARMPQYNDNDREMFAALWADLLKRGDPYYNRYLDRESYIPRAG